MRWNTITSSKLNGGLGLRRARETNVALLGKHVWEVLHDSNKLWVQLLTSRHLHDQSVLTCQSPSNALYTWRSILRAAAMLKDGFIWRVGRGDLSLWYDKWL